MYPIFSYAFFMPQDALGKRKACLFDFSESWRCFRGVDVWALNRRKAADEGRRLLSAALPWQRYAQQHLVRSGGQARELGLNREIWTNFSRSFGSRL